MAGNKKMTLIIIGVAAVALAAFLALWYFLFVNRANRELPKNELRIDSGVFNVELATTTMEQARGLSFREGLGENDGMLFVFNTPAVQHFWMKDMNFPLDMIWIASDTVTGFAENAQAEPGVPLWSLTIYSSPDGVDKVLEVNAGTVAKYGIKVGDKVTFGG